MWILAVIILLVCFHEVFGKPILWLTAGGIAGYFIAKHNIPAQLKQKVESYTQSSENNTDVAYYKRLAQEMMEENIKLRTQAK